MGDTQNLADLSAICLHLSVWAATVPQSVSEGTSQHQPFRTDSLREAPQARLTPRELQIAELVALGRKNAEIGTS